MSKKLTLSTRGVRKTETETEEKEVSQFLSVMESTANKIISKYKLEKSLWVDTSTTSTTSSTTSGKRKRKKKMVEKVDVCEEVLGIVKMYVMSKQRIPPGETVEKFIEYVVTTMVSVSGGEGSTTPTPTPTPTPTLTPSLGIVQGSLAEGEIEGLIQSVGLKSRLYDLRRINSPVKDKRVVENRINMELVEDELENEKEMILSSEPKDNSSKLLYYLKCFQFDKSSSVSPFKEGRKFTFLDSSSPISLDEKEVDGKREQGIKMFSLEQLLELCRSDPDLVSTNSGVVVVELVKYGLDYVVSFGPKDGKLENVYSEEFKDLLVDVFYYLNPKVLRKYVGRFIQVLRAPGYFETKEKTLNLLFKIGNSAILQLIGVLQQSLARKTNVEVKSKKGRQNTEWESMILSCLANHPLVIQGIIVPALLRECASKSMNRKLMSVFTLRKLGSICCSTFTLSKLSKMFENGSLDRRVTALALRSFGERGEKYLLHQLLNHYNIRVRGCSGYAFSKAVSLSKNLTILVDVSPDSLHYFTKNKILFRYCDDGVLIFDHRDIMIKIKGVFSGEGYYKLEEEDEEEEEKNVSVPYKIPQGLEKKILTLMKGKIKDTELYFEDKGAIKVKNLENRFFNREDVIATLVAGMGDPEGRVRSEIARAMGCILDSNLLVPLIKHIQDASPVVRAEVITSLGRLESLVNTEKQCHYLGVELCGVLTDKMYNIRLQSCITISKIGTKFSKDQRNKIFAILDKSFLDGTINRNEIAKCYISLGETGVYKVLSIISNETKYNTKHREAAAFGLRYFHPSIFKKDKKKAQHVFDTVVESLFNSSNDGIAKVRLVVVNTIVYLAKRFASHPYLSNSSVLPFLFNFLKDKEKIVRKFATKHLSSFGKEGAELFVRGLSHDKHVIVRQYSAVGLSLPVYGAAYCHEVLLAFSKERDTSVRKYFRVALQKMGIRRIVAQCVAKKSRKFVKGVITLVTNIMKKKGNKVSVLQLLKRELLNSVS